MAKAAHERSVTKTVLAIIIALILVPIVAFGGCAVFGTLYYPVQKQQMSQNAQDFDAQSFLYEKGQNAAQAKQDYDGKTFRCEGTVERIGSDQFTISLYPWGNEMQVDVVSTDELAKLQRGDVVTVVGTFDSDFEYLRNAFIEEQHTLQTNAEDSTSS